ncbi:MAG: 16S rRNA (adenine(1518)-N(6)/adenine(1519)-N(6))-dimethyltransferase RsmA [Actinomycetota bacterium]|nr:16S rRNA (adenine(1518)-N(6)/adenine(1519)-N(6))-dimethyltransferase RsmA [Actinomycetota bacterium]
MEDKKQQNLLSPAVVSRILSEEGIFPRKGFGQHFLIDANVLKAIIKAAALSSDDYVVEVGAGIGTLTQALLEQGAKVFAIEPDPKLFDFLLRGFKAAPNLRLFNEDALELDLHRALGEIPAMGVKLVSNLPYQIASTLIVDFLARYPWIQEYVVMVQLEVANRIIASPGGKNYSAATVKIGHYAKARKVANVSKKSFYPTPKVNSAILKIERARGEENPTFNRFFESLVGKAFSERRKKLVNSLSRSPLPSIQKEDVICALRKLGISSNSRGEELSIENFEALADILWRILKERTLNG